MKREEFEARETLARVYEEIARVGKALSSPHRLVLIELLSQAPHAVEELAANMALPIANVSQHLQILKGVGLVTARREGIRMVYALAGDDVVMLTNQLRLTAERRVAEVERALRDWLAGREELEAITAEELAARVAEGAVTVVDVRPARDFETGHIPGSINVPVEEFETRLRQLPKDHKIVAYCRAAYCLCADDAVRYLRNHGFEAARLEVGFPQWRAGGHEVESEALSPRERVG
jgi:ArsR family transcriptional regulator